MHSGLPTRCQLITALVIPPLLDSFGVTTSLTLQLVDDPGLTNDYIITGELSARNAAVFAEWALNAPNNSGAFFVATVSQARFRIVIHHSQNCV